MKLSKVGQQKFMNDRVWNAEEERDFLRLHVRERETQGELFVCTVVGFGEKEELATGKKVDLVESCWTEYSQTRPGDSNRKDKTLAQPSKEESNTV